MKKFDKVTGTFKQWDVTQQTLLFNLLFVGSKHKIKFAKLMMFLSVSPEIVNTVRNEKG